MEVDLQDILREKASDLTLIRPQSLPPDYAAAVIVGQVGRGIIGRKAC